jgi:preprotein translocase subunit SecE
MAQPDREQRRNRRARRPQPALAGGPAAAPQRRSAPAGAEREPARESQGFGPANFVRESAGELNKVEWPGQQQLIQGTLVVLIACIVVGAYLYLNDKVWQYVVHHVLLR